MSGADLEEKVGAEEREADDSGAAESDQLHHGDHQPGEHQASAQFTPVKFSYRGSEFVIFS